MFKWQLLDQYFAFIKLLTNPVSRQKKRPAFLLAA
ncbi:hypothetical protein HAL1_04646 [Halomonas sp. HAL1]|nr:hypothetical protein HAL1_04646 [Halomonas sp. HAL1]